MIADFHRRNVRVLFPIMLWDQGTRDLGEPEWDALAKELAEIGADGVNGDTMIALPRMAARLPTRPAIPWSSSPSS